MSAANIDSCGNVREKYSRNMCSLVEYFPEKLGLLHTLDTYTLELVVRGLIHTF